MHKMEALREQKANQNLRKQFQQVLRDKQEAEVQLKHKMIKLKECEEKLQEKEEILVRMLSRLKPRRTSFKRSFKRRRSRRPSNTSPYS